MAHVFDQFSVCAEQDHDGGPVVVLSCDMPECHWEEEFYAQQLSMVTAAALLHRTTVHHDGSPI